MEQLITPVSGRPNIDNEQQCQLSWNFNEVLELNQELDAFKLSQSEEVICNIAYEFLDVISGIAIWGKSVMYDRPVKEQAVYTSILNSALYIVTIEQILEYRIDWDIKKSKKYPENSEYRTTTKLLKAYREYQEFNNTVK
jgi:hypothetical protein